MHIPSSTTTPTTTPTMIPVVAAFELADAVAALSTEIEGRDESCLLKNNGSDAICLRITSFFDRINPTSESINLIEAETSRLPIVTTILILQNPILVKAARMRTIASIWLGLGGNENAIEILTNGALLGGQVDGFVVATVDCVVDEDGNLDIVVESTDDATIEVDEALVVDTATGDVDTARDVVVDVVVGALVVDTAISVVDIVGDDTDVVKGASVVVLDVDGTKVVGAAVSLVMVETDAVEELTEQVEVPSLLQILS